MTEHARSHLIHASGDDGINAFGIEDEIHCSLDEITHHIAPCAIPAQNRELHENPDSVPYCAERVLVVYTSVSV